MGFHASRRSGVLLAAAVLLLPALPLSAQVPEATTAALKQIFASRTYAPERFGPARWIEDGTAYTTLERSAETKGGFDIVRYDSKTGARSILDRRRARSYPPATRRRSPIDDYIWSPDAKQLLIFTNTEAGLAAEHPRRLLGARPRHRRAPPAGRRRRAPPRR